VGEEWDHCGMSDQLAVRVVHKEEHQVEGIRRKTRHPETAEAASRVSRSRAFGQASAMRRVGGGRRCRRCREKMEGRVRRASSEEGLLEVLSLALVPIRVQERTPTVYHHHLPTCPTINRHLLRVRKNSKTAGRSNGPTSSSRSLPLSTRYQPPILRICRRLKRRRGLWRQGRANEGGGW
jgi:hypothetical protein